MENKNILITGASGNIGFEIIRGLKHLSTPHRIIAADYKPENAQKILAEFDDLTYRRLDFADPASFDDALVDVDIVFCSVLRSWPIFLNISPHSWRQ
jgi:uncharacterized protein YbjT (DUF2867 family)